jgi:hypothetical protein
VSSTLTTSATACPRPTPTSRGPLGLAYQVRGDAVPPAQQVSARLLPQVQEHHDLAVPAGADGLGVGTAPGLTATRTAVLRGHRDHLHTVCGSIELTQQLHRSPGRDLPLAVPYQSLDEDTSNIALLRPHLCLTASICSSSAPTS